MALTNIVKSIPLSVLNAANLHLNAFTVFPLPLPTACFMIRIINASNAFVVVSYDGVNIHDAIFPEEQLTLPFQQHSQPNGQVAWMKEGTRVYLEGDPVAANGFIYLCGYYQT